MASLKVAPELVKAIANVMYPVGSFYFSSSTTNPSSYLGGTWVRVTGGFLYGSTITSGSQNTYSTGNGTGTNTNDHTLTIDQIPSHDHEFPGRMVVWDDGTNATDVTHRNVWDSVIQFYPWGKRINKTGGGKAHKHNIPYIACSIWRRTA